MRTLKEQRELDDRLSEFKYKCMDCWHSVTITPIHKDQFVYCKFCGTKIYSKKYFIDKLKQKLERGKK